jgi:hypothetical protein
MVLDRSFIAQSKRQGYASVARPLRVSRARHLPSRQDDLLLRGRPQPLHDAEPQLLGGGPMSRLPKRLTDANVVSTLAFFIPLTGASAVTAPKIAAPAVKQGKLAPDPVSGGTVASNLSQVPSAVYCIVLRGFKRRGAQATPRNVHDGGVSGYVTVGGTESCPVPGVEVRIFQMALTSEPFYVSLYR